MSSQTQPNIENGLKPFGSYDSGNIETINTLNGNLMIHIPLPFTYPQRGNVQPENELTLSSKAWHVDCQYDSTDALRCAWTFGYGLGSIATTGQGVMVDDNMDLGVTRTYDYSSGPDGNGPTTGSATNYALNTWDGSVHQLHQSANNVNVLDVIDASGYRVVLGPPDFTGVATSAIVIDRAGNQYQTAQFSGPCTTTQNNDLPGNTRETTCTQGAPSVTMTDVHGNVFNVGGVDTMGRPFTSYSSIAPTSDFSGCVGGGASIVSASMLTYAGYNGAQNQIKECFAAVTINTQFSQAGIPQAGPYTARELATLVLPDGTNWNFRYDNYGNVVYIGLPAGGSISYTWRETSFPTCQTAAFVDTLVSRSVATRTINDNNDHSYFWNYQWGTANGTTLTNIITDPAQNDTVHTFTAIDGQCMFYETSQSQYQGSAASGTLLKRVDTTYSGGPTGTSTGFGGFGTIVPRTIKTSLFPSNRVSLVTRDYDPGAGGGDPSMGNIITEKVYDWGNGAPGPLLQETDTSFLWQSDARYLAAHLIDLPSSVIVKDGSGNRLSETDYRYDETGYLQSYESIHGALPAGTHVAAPNPVRGNQTSVSRWLNTAANPIVRHTIYFDTGSSYQSIDPQNHRTTFGYHSAYAGAYLTSTCNALLQCVSATYDFTTGKTSTFTDENGATPASGTTPGDPAHTSSYVYDAFARMTTASFPDGGGTTLTYPSTTRIDVRTKLTASDSDTTSLFLDGLGRQIRTQHPTPSGTTTTDNVYDGLGHVVSTSNPYFTTNDATYGLHLSQFDALGRPTRDTQQDGSVATIDYSLGNCATHTDEAGALRRQCTDALGRLVEVDEPGNSFAGSRATNSLTINGSLQSTVTGGTGASPATGSVTIGGSEQSFTVVTQTTASGSATIALSGSDSFTQGDCTVINNVVRCPPKVYDSGNITITVNVSGTIYSAQATYGQFTTAAGMADSLASSFQGMTSNGHAVFGVTHTAGTPSLTLAATATGAATNYPISYAINSAQGSSGFGVTLQGSSAANNTFTGGRDLLTSTTYDTGTVSITVNGHTDQIAYGQGDTSASIATNIAARINSDAAAFVTAAVSGPVVNLTSKTSGTAANVSLSAASAYDAAHFSAPSFSTTPSGGSLTGGSNGTSSTTIYDSGSVSVSVGGFNASVAYGASGNSTASQVAAALATALNASASPVLATSSAATITITYKNVGAAGNVAVTSSSTTSQSTYFTAPSFSSSGTTLAGGADPRAPSLDNPYTTTYAYDALGNLLSVTQRGDSSQAARVRTFQYDSLSRLLTSSNPESGTLTYAYDDDDKMIRKTDDRGVVITYTHDPLHRLTSRQYPDGTSTTYQYDHVPWFNSQNSVGRLVNESNNVNAATIYSYDAMGRIAFEGNWTPSNPAATANPVNATYDFAGNLATLTYPSGRTVAFTYNNGNQLDRVQFTKWQGTSLGTPYSYAANADTNYFPNGTPRSLTLGNGIVESFQFNRRLQPTEDRVELPAVAAFSDHTYSYTSAATPGNNGNILAVNDQLNAARTQMFTYDALNRLASATESRWTLGYVYDPWGNRIQQNVLSGIGSQMQITVDAKNRIAGAPAGCTSATLYCYDAAGNLLNDGYHQYAFDANDRIRQVDGGTASYTYDAQDRRIRKDVTGVANTEYIYFGGSPIAEKDVATGLWSDYIFAGTTRIARADTFINVIKTQGTCVTTSSCRSQFWFSGTNLTGYKIKSGDKLFLVQLSSAGASAGPGLNYTDANGNLTYGDLITNVFDQDGCAMNTDCASFAGTYHFRRLDLTPLAGMTISSEPFVETAWTAVPNTSWTVSYGAMALVGADGVVHPIFGGLPFGKSLALTTWNQPGASSLAYAVDRSSCGTCTSLVTSYSHADQVKSSRLLTTAGGWPVWQATFLPFGEEYMPQDGTQHYRFSGKERDPESRLDYFGARYYTSDIGRFMSPDWSPTPATVPFADLNDPQSLNLYAYVRNSPIVRLDANGHFDDPFGIFSDDDTSMSNIQSRFTHLPKDAKPKPKSSPNAAGAAVGVGAAAAGAAAAAQGAMNVANSNSTPGVDACHAQLRYRPAMAGHTHAWWWLSIGLSDYIISGTGLDVDLINGPVTNAHVKEGQQSESNPKDTTTNGTAAFDTRDWHGGFASPDDCGVVREMLDRAQNWPNYTLPYDPVNPFDPITSNTVAFYVGWPVHDYLTPPPNSLGWGTFVDGLPYNDTHKH